MTMLSNIAKSLFKRRLLPARFEHDIHFELEEREAGFLGWWSYHRGLNPSFEAYLREHGVTWRTRSRKSGPSGALIMFWSKADYDLYVKAHKVPSFFAHQRMRIELEELEYQHVMFPYSYGFARYRLFDNKELVFLMLKHEWTKDRGYLEFKDW